MDKKVSVIIPVYNDEKNINISINSLLNQTSESFEVIIIDDGSRDHTKERVLELIRCDKRFHYIYQENAGVSAARNKGMELAQGDYICFLDSDDFFENTYIEKMLEKIENEKADVCYCGYNIVSPISKKRKRTRFISDNLLIHYILGKVSIHTTGWLIRKKLLNQYLIRFPEGVSWGEDFEFFCEVLARSNKNVFVKEYLTNYRIGFEENRLSAFAIEKLDKDYDSINRIFKKITMTDNKMLEEALLGYRLQALLIYRFLLGFKSGVTNKEILDYYKKYESCLKSTSWNNGLRSVKLNTGKIILKIKIHRLKLKLR